MYKLQTCPVLSPIHSTTGWCVSMSIHEFLFSDVWYKFIPFVRVDRNWNGGLVRNGNINLKHTYSIITQPDNKIKHECGMGMCGKNVTLKFSHCLSVSLLICLCLLEVFGLTIDKHIANQMYAKAFLSLVKILIINFGATPQTPHFKKMCQIQIDSWNAIFTGETIRWKSFNKCSFLYYKLISGA